MLIVSYVLNKIKQNQLLFISLIVVFLVGFLLGIFFDLPQLLSELYSSFVIDIFNNALFNKEPIFSFFFTRILNLILLYLISFLLCLNGISFFGIFALIFYRAYVLAVAVKTCAISLKFLGIIPFIFTVFLESFTVTFSLIIYAVLCYEYYEKRRDCFIEKHVKKTLICFIIGVLGIIVECLFLICIFRPINFYF